MAQENRHLTTEQLSAYLDEQHLSAEEQHQLEAHLKSCEPCQQELADLRQTVALLHALPRPALPRSFVLPLDIQPVDNLVENEAEESELVPVPLAAAYSSAPAMREMKRTRRWPTYARTALRTVSAIAAVIGLVLFLSGVLASFPRGGMTAASYSTASQGNAQSANVASNNDNSGAAKPQISPSSRATITPTSAAEATKATTITSQATPEADQRTVSAPVPAASSQSPTILFFDLSSGPGRLGFGFLLLLLGVMGYVTFKRRWRQERA